MKPLRRILTLFFCLLTQSSVSFAALDPEISTAIDDLKRAAVAKIDGEVEMNSRAFLNAKELRDALWLSDILAPIVTLSKGALEGVVALGSPDNFADLFSTLFTNVEDTGKFVALMMSWDKLTQSAANNGTNLAIALDGPAYGSAVNSMLRRADETTVVLFGFDVDFNPDAYRLSISNDLLGIAGNSSPFVIVHKSTRADRRGGGKFNTLNAARSHILSSLSTLKTELSTETISASQKAEILTFLRAREYDIKKSRAGHWRSTYDTFLTTDSGPRKLRVTHSLGTLTLLEKWRAQMLAAFAANLDVVIEAEMKELKEFITEGAFHAISKKLKLSGRIGGSAAVDILADFQSLAISAYDGLSGAGESDQGAYDFTTNARQQIDSIPQQMMDAFPGEVSKLLILVEDAAFFSKTVAETPPIVNPPATAPVAPTNLTATAVSSSQINLRWTDNSNNETGFKLQRRTASSAAWADISTETLNKAKSPVK